MDTVGIDSIQQPITYSLSGTIDTKASPYHEYYGAHLGMLTELRKPRKGFHFLERQTFELPGIRFLGCTLWSGFTLLGADKVNNAMAIARQNINDYWMINAAGGKRLEPKDTRAIHKKSVAWLDDELSKPFDGRTVVITHFAPHRGCVAPQHQGSDVSPYFVTDMSRLMENHKIDLWCFGHTHTNVDMLVKNGCRLISNQRGYPGELASMNFRENLIIELDAPRLPGRQNSGIPVALYPQKSADQLLLEVRPRSDGFVHVEDIPEPFRGHFKKQLYGLPTNKLDRIHRDTWREWRLDQVTRIDQELKDAVTINRNIVLNSSIPEPWRSQFLASNQAKSQCPQEGGVNANAWASWLRKVIYLASGDIT